MYRPAASRSLTWPAGMTALRLNGAAWASTGSLAYWPPASAARTTSAWTRPMRSMIGVSLNGASAMDSATLAVPMTWLTYSTTFLCWSVIRSTISGSSGTVLEFSTREESETTFHAPPSYSTSKSKQVSRWPQHSGSDSTTVFPVSLLTTRRCGISLWAWPTRTASMPGTCSASATETFSAHGSWSP